MTHPIEDEVTDDDQIDYGLTAEDWQHVGRHSLPEVDQEILNLGGREEGERDESEREDKNERGRREGERGREKIRSREGGEREREDKK